MADLGITSVNEIASNAIEQAKQMAVPANEGKESEDGFSSLLSAAMNMVNETNNLTNQMEAEKLNFAMGFSDNAHDLMIAQKKAVLSLQYTVAVKNKLLEAYKEIINIQI